MVTNLAECRSMYLQQTNDGGRRIPASNSLRIATDIHVFADAGGAVDLEMVFSSGGTYNCLPTRTTMTIILQLLHDHDLSFDQLAEQSKLDKRVVRCDRARPLHAESRTASANSGCFGR